MGTQELERLILYLNNKNSLNCVKNKMGKGKGQDSLSSYYESPEKLYP